MKAPVFVLDTHALVWYAKGSVRKIGFAAFNSVHNNQAWIVIPLYVFTEIQRGFSHKMDTQKDQMRVPPTPLLRLICNCSNVRILPREAATVAWEFKLMRNRASNGISEQDVPIAAATLVVRDYYKGPVRLVTNDGPLSKWAASAGIPIIWK